MCSQTCLLIMILVMVMVSPTRFNSLFIELGNLGEVQICLCLGCGAL